MRSKVAQVIPPDLTFKDSMCLKARVVGSKVSKKNDLKGDKIGSS